jgi:purine-binding chemotaxis protein CheW
MRPLPLEAFPRAPAFVAGLAVIRGAPTPVVDMRILMGESRGSAGGSTAGRFITVRIGERTGEHIVALAVDAVLGVHQLAGTQVMDLPPLLKSVAGETISAVTSRDTELLLFFETARIFPPGLLETLTKERAAG